MTSPRRDAILIKIEELQEGCPKLRVLRLANSEFVLGEVSIKDQVCTNNFIFCLNFNIQGLTFYTIYYPGFFTRVSLFGGAKHSGGPEKMSS